MEREDLLKIYNMDTNEVIKKYGVPPLGIEHTIKSFGKIGYTYAGIYEGFIFLEENFNNITELEKWKLIALSNIYWHSEYSVWWDENYEEIRSLNKTIKELKNANNSFSMIAEMIMKHYNKDEICAKDIETYAQYIKEIQERLKVLDKIERGEQ